MRRIRMRANTVCLDAEFFPVAGAGRLTERIEEIIRSAKFIQ
jgi:hypothetical protein